MTETVYNKNMKEYHQKLLDEIDNIKMKNQLKGQPNKSINTNDIKDAILNACDILFIDYSRDRDMSQYTYGIYDPISQSYIRDDKFLSELIEYIISNLDSTPALATSSIKKNVDDAIMASKHSVRVANQPPQHIVKFKNCVYDLKHKRQYEFDDEEIKDYDFVTTIQYNLKSCDDVDQEMLSIAKRVFHTWSQDNEDILKLIKQIAYACIEGNGRGQYIILQSEGGDGKSTFLTILERLTRDKLTVYANLDEYDNDNVLNAIEPSTKLIIGDDLQSNFKMNNKILSRFKTLTSGGAITVGVKYMPNKLIQTNALKIQNTNTEVKFYENNPAIKDRIIYVYWPHYNFRQNPVTDFNLDELIGKYGLPNIAFIEAVLAYIIETVEYFDHFHVTNQMKNDLEDMLDDNDVVLQHYLTVKEMGITSYSHIPTLVLYEHFKQWLRSVNPGAKPMHQRSYTKKMMQYFKEEGYTKAETKMIKKLDSSQFDLQFFENIAIDDSYRSKILIQPTSDQYDQAKTLIDDIKHMDQTEFKETHLESELKNYIQYLIHNDPRNMLLISSRHDYTVDELKTLDIDYLTEILYDSIDDLIE